LSVCARSGVAHFVAVRVPYGSQHEEEHAALAQDFIRPEEMLTVNVQAPADAMMASLKRRGAQYVDDFHEDFAPGNIKARQRMVAQYAIAGARVEVVIGTDHAAGSLMGFATHKKEDADEPSHRRSFPAFDGWRVCSRRGRW
jgi:NAD+ synthase